MAKVERGNPIADKGNTYHFYKTNLPAVIWNPEKNAPLAEFKNGRFSTRSKKKAQKLLELGYPQISPTAQEPPDVIKGLPGQSIDTGPDSVENIRPGMRENENAKPMTPELQTE